MPKILDNELIAELERRWRAQSPALLERLKPGLDDAEIDEFSRPLGYRLPEEVRRWYRWNNGSAGQMIIFWRAFNSLSDDVARTLEFEEDDENWPKGWLKVMDDKPYVIFDCRGPVDAPAPVWHFDYSFDLDRPTRPVFDSIGDMVLFWIDLIERRLMSWDAEGELHLQEPIPPEALQKISGVPTD
jgi:hypothetical protein